MSQKKNEKNEKNEFLKIVKKKNFELKYSQKVGKKIISKFENVPNCSPPPL